MKAPTKAALIKEVAKWKKEANDRLDAGAALATENDQLREYLNNFREKQVEKLVRKSQDCEALRQANEEFQQNLLLVKADAYDLAKINESLKRD